MKRNALIPLTLALLVLTSACNNGGNPSQASASPQSSAAGQSNDPAQSTGYDPSDIAGVDDLVIGSLRYGNTEADLTAVMGEPDSTNEYEWAADGSYYKDYAYENNIFGFLKNEEGVYTLVSVYITEGAFSASRGIVSGMTRDEVIARFPNNYTGSIPTEMVNKILYTSGIKTASDGSEVIMPPRGLIYGEDEAAVEYIFPLTDYPANMDPAEFVYYHHGIITFSFDEEGTLAGISWRAGPLAD